MKTPIEHIPRIVFVSTIIAAATALSSTAALGRDEGKRTINRSGGAARSFAPRARPMPSVSAPRFTQRSSQAVSFQAPRPAAPRPMTVRRDPIVRAPAAQKPVMRSPSVDRQVAVRPQFNQPRPSPAVRPDVSRSPIARPTLTDRSPAVRPDFNQPAGRGGPARVTPDPIARRDDGSLFFRGDRDRGGDHGDRWNPNQWNRNGWVGSNRGRDWDHSRYGRDFYRDRLRYCGPFSSSYYCRGYRPLYYYPRAYPYAYNTVYLYDTVPYPAYSAGLYSGAVAFGPSYVETPTYVADSGYASGYATNPGYAVQPESQTYVDNSVNAPSVQGYVPSDQARESAQPTQPPQSAENSQPTGDYQTLTGAGANTAIGQGNAAFRAGKFEEARQHYSRAVLGDERDGYAKVLYATANFATGDYGVAATAIRRALLTTPELTTYPIDLRSLYADPTTLYGQMDALAKHLTAHSDDRDAAFLLAYLHYSIGEPQPAQAMFKLLAETDSTDTVASQLYQAASRAVEAVKSQPQQQGQSSPGSQSAPPSQQPMQPPPRPSVP